MRILFLFSRQTTSSLLLTILFYFLFYNQEIFEILIFDSLSIGNLETN